MRTEMSLLRALAVAVALLAFPPAALHAQDADTAAGARDTAVSAGEVPAAAQPEPIVRRRVGDRVTFMGSRTIAEDEIVGDAVVVGGRLQVHGIVEGDAVVVGGRLTLHPTGRIDGDVVVVGGRFDNHGGQVVGEIETREQAGVVVRSRTEERGAFHRVGRAIAGLISTLAVLLVLVGIGAVVVFYARAHLDTVSDTARAATLRSGAVGLAATFLIIPVYAVLLVGLAISIVGIPLLLIAAPLYPIAVIAAIALGLLASAHALGERTAEQREGFQLRYHNSYAYLFLGLGLLLAPFAAGHLVGMVGFLGFVGGLLRFIGVLAIWGAVTVGLGAVILSRAGTRRTFVPPIPAEILEDDAIWIEEDDLEPR
jgi:hypothetical protein